MSTKKTVVVGMSGGVDSSVAAYLLKEQGYNVIGVTMQIWQDDDDAKPDGGCCGLSAVNDARRVADILDIPYYVMNFKREFKEQVIDYFVDEYVRGRTPNPCIACNSHVKWESLLHKALSIGADYIATGHYARVVSYPETGRWTLKQSSVPEKDQTYALYGLTQPQLARTLMPAGEYAKVEIRKIAADLGLMVADKPDSQEICFVPDNDYAGFIQEHTGRTFPPGRFVDISGNALGEHEGIIHYTVGQRKGLRISFGRRMYVKSVSAEKNEVVLAEDSELFEPVLSASRVNFMGIAGISSPIRAKAKIRYGHAAQLCTAAFENGVLQVAFDEPQRAVTPGQAVVVYDEAGEHVLCGGVIETACSA